MYVYSLALHTMRRLRETCTSNRQYRIYWQEQGIHIDRDRIRLPLVSVSTKLLFLMKICYLCPSVSTQNSPGTL
jgi:hypothetical protein